MTLHSTVIYTHFWVIWYFRTANNSRGEFGVRDAGRTAVGTGERSYKDDNEIQVGESKRVGKDLAEQGSGIWYWSASGFGRMLNGRVAD